MRFSIDKNYARRHYAKNSLLFIFISIWVFFVSFLLIIFYVSNISIMVFATILMILSIVFTTIFLIIYLLGSYKGLSISNNTITLLKDEIFIFRDSGRDITEKNKYNYKIISINNISIQNRYIIIQGSFDLLVQHQYQNSKIIKNKQMVKIPRIFADEDKIISILNDIKKGSV